VKKLLFTSLFLLVVGSIGFSAYNYYSIRYQIAYVDIGRVVNQYEEMINARKQYESKYRSRVLALDSLGNQLEQEFYQYMTTADKLARQEREQKESMLNIRKEILGKQKSELDRVMKDEDAKLTAGIYQKINDFTKKYGKEHPYKIILGATASGNIMYSRDYVDITEDFIVEINKQK
jgi:outer membrane protein